MGLTDLWRRLWVGAAVALFTLSAGAGVVLALTGSACSICWTGHSSNDSSTASNWSTSDGRRGAKAAESGAATTGRRFRLPIGALVLALTLAALCATAAVASADQLRAFGSWLRSSRTLSCVLMVVGVCVSGCGGGAVSRSSTAATLTPASTTTGSTTAKDMKTTGQPRIKSKTTASTLAGGVARRKRSRFVPPTRRQALLLSASSECAIARARAPSSPLPTTNRTTTIVAYAAASWPTAARVAKSLGDIPGRKPPPVSRLINDYRKLASAYAAASTHVSHGVSGDRLSQTLSHAEQRTAADALVARVPVCAPLPPSARGAKRK